MLRRLFELADWLDGKATKVVLTIPNEVLDDRERLQSAMEEITNYL
jgi:hypothetical protein